MIKPITGAVIQARMNSSRLPGKILSKIDGEPLLGILVNRLRHAKTLDKIIVATTGSPKDGPIVEFCQKETISCMAEQVTTH